MNENVLALMLGKKCFKLWLKNNNNYYVHENLRENVIKIIDTNEMFVSV